MQRNAFGTFVFLCLDDFEHHRPEALSTPLRPDHYLYPAYQLANHGQVHCPGGTGYSRWTREQVKPEMHNELFSRHLEISSRQVELVTRDHIAQKDAARQLIVF